MAKIYTDEFRRDAVRIATTSGVLQCHAPGRRWPGCRCASGLIKGCILSSNLQKGDVLIFIIPARNFALLPLLSHLSN